MTEGAGDRHQAVAHYFAALVTAKGGTNDARLVAAFAATPRERFVGPCPWKVFAGLGYIETPSAELAYLYQDVLVGLAPERGINNGEPSLHARCLAALKPDEGETVLHIGAGSGYYSAILARLVGPSGAVTAYEIESDLAERAAGALADLANVRVMEASGARGPLPMADVIYVNAGATHPLQGWLDALKPGGRLLFPLTPNEGLGGMLLVKREASGFAARFVSFALFVACAGAREEDTTTLAAAFRGGRLWEVRSLHRGTAPDASCWHAGHGWWLSTRPH